MRSWKLTNINPNKVAEGFEDAVIPQDISTWIQHLGLLYGVPFNYLIPDERMLPIESLRFFQLDPNWITALIEGAYSIGRTTKTEILHDKFFQKKMHSQMQNSNTIRKTLLKTPMAKMENESLPPLPTFPISGFFLRSAVVSGWPGLEVYPFEDIAKTQPLEILRLEKLSDNVLFCLVQGELKTLVLQEPSEILHFGVELQEGAPACNTALLKRVRSLKAGSIGQEIKDTSNNYITLDLNSVLRSKDTRVINIAQLAASFHSTLQAQQGEVIKFTSAEFGLEMVEGVQSVTFNPKS